MDPITLLLIAMVIGTVTTAAGSAVNYAATETANDRNVELANTAHQREVADLKAAGLNPYLSLGGNGAGGSVMANTAIGNGLNGIGNSISSALQSMVTLKMMEMVQSAKDIRLDKKLSSYASRYASKGVKNTDSRYLKRLTYDYTKKAGYYSNMDDWDDIIDDLTKY